MIDLVIYLLCQWLMFKFEVFAFTIVFNPSVNLPLLTGLH